MRNLGTILFTAFILLQSCTKDDPLAFDVIESPVQAAFEVESQDTDPMLRLVGTFMDLDKSGILDQNVGIVSTPINGLELTILANGDSEISRLTTSTDGTVIFEYDKDELAGVATLEWSGTYDEVPFTILYKL